MKGSIPKNRHVGIEMLRVIAMLMVFSLHFIFNGEYCISHDNIVNFESWIIVCLSVVAVNCYVLISGYFMSEKSFRLVRFSNTYIEVLFYSVATFLVFVILGINDFSLGDAFRAATPFIHNSYWFAISYLLLLLFTPLLNSAINNLDRNKFKLILSLNSYLNFIFFKKYAY